MKHFTGIGSRNIPFEYYERMEHTCAELCKMGYILRSGGADGADHAAEVGCDKVGGKKEIYLPFKRFNANNSELHIDNVGLFGYDILDKTWEYVKEIHPAPDKLFRVSKLLHQRNCLQILGKDLKTPSEFVVCYTDDGTAKGGTATAINLAKRLGIPVYNLYNDGVEKFIEFV